MSNEIKLQEEKTYQMTRRDFMRAAAGTGAGLMLGDWILAQQENPAASNSPNGQLQIAMIGVGSQGRNLLNNCLKIDGVRFVAITDIWDYHRDYASKILEKYKQPVNAYADYREMLEKEKGKIDAVIIATPDWMHAEHTEACLRAGIPTYCEKEMSNTLEGAALMVKVQRETGVPLQIGHQRRSNPRYWHALKLIEKDRVLGRITHIEGQWNRPVQEPIGWPETRTMDPATLERWGYESMNEFRNWRWYKKYSGGPFSDLGSHQIDIFSWFLKVNPTAVLAAGGTNYYEGREWEDNVIAIYEYPGPEGMIRGHYRVLNTTSHGGYYETFMGDEGTMVISEDINKGFFFREARAARREWEDESEKIEAMGTEAIELKLGETLTAEGKKDPEGQKLLEMSQKPVHQLHLENFFNAIQGNGELTCPPEVGYETAVAVLRTHDAVDSGCRLEFKPEEFKVS